MSNKQKKILQVSRLVLFPIFAVVLPFCFIIWRYELFTKVSSVQIGGWGLIGIVIVFCFAIYVLNELKEVLAIKNKWSMSLQIIQGLLKVVLPLLVLYFLINSIENSINLFKQALLVCIVCECVAIPLNPFPQMKVEAKSENEDRLVGKIKGLLQGEKTEEKE